jgi:H+/Cl- antiporter ClcA
MLKIKIPRGELVPFRWSWREQLLLAGYLLKWFVIAAPVAAIVGSAVALLLWSLDLVTHQRFVWPWLLFFLPLAGASISALYSILGAQSEGGNNLLMDAIYGFEDDEEHDEQPDEAGALEDEQESIIDESVEVAAQNAVEKAKDESGTSDSGVVVPRRMAPLILIATIVTHLCGGSVGREGTALQMGGSIAATCGELFHLSRADMRMLLMAGIAAGFGAVFGTPLAGAVFALEVLVVGRVRYDALIPCLFAAAVGAWTCSAWGIDHWHRTIELSGIATEKSLFDWALALKVAVAGVAFGLVCVLFAELTHSIDHFFKRKIARPLWRPVVGGVLVIALTYLLGTRDYLGLGIYTHEPNGVTVLTAFYPNGAGDWSWWWKLFFTALTLGSGFKGGEVTPMFFIGATLGNVLAHLMGAPVELFAALGFVAVFAGAINTPLAGALMGIELFGSQGAIYFAIACFIAYASSGHSGIYLSQRIGTPKLRSVALPPHASLRTARDMKKRRRKTDRKSDSSEGPQA